MKAGEVSDTDKPKLPKNSYFQYLSERRPEFPDSGLSYKAFLSKVGSDWKEVSIKDKKKYQENFERDIEKYQLELSIWKKGCSDNK